MQLCSVTAVPSAPPRQVLWIHGPPPGPSQNGNCMTAWLAVSEKEGSPECLTPSTEVEQSFSGRGLEAEEQREGGMEGEGEREKEGGMVRHREKNGGRRGREGDGEGGREGREEEEEAEERGGEGEREDGGGEGRGREEERGREVEVFGVWLHFPVLLPQGCSGVWILK